VNQAFKLFRLQQIDSQLDRVSERQAEIERLLADDQVIRESQGLVGTAHTASEQARRDLLFTESETKAQQDKLKENQNTLYSGKVTNPKELQELQQEAELLTRHVSEHEDKQLAQMEQLEQLQAAAQQAEANLEAAIAQRGVNQRTLNTELGELELEARRLLEERETALSGVEEEARVLYGSLRKSKNGLAIAKVSNKTCSACGAELSASLAEAARSPQALARCDSCKRILYSG
jgi:predicted  nucleic acid-binding Zn-ribbon protein